MDVVHIETVTVGIGGVQQNSDPENIFINAIDICHYMMDCTGYGFIHEISNILHGISLLI